MKGITVVQSWLSERCTWKQQTVVLTAMRGCDGAPKDDRSKDLLHNFRATVLNDADPSTGFMQQREYDIDDFCNNLDHYPVHFILHLTHAIEIIGYNHPDPITAEKWNMIYVAISHAMHYQPEPKEDNELRLADKSTRRG